MERRRWDLSELRAETVEDGGTAIEGYAAVFDSLSVPMTSRYGVFRERVARNAFENSIEDDVRALWNHDPSFVLGRTTAGTLNLAEDAHGLRIRIHPPDTQIGRDAVVSIGRGDVDQMSFAFSVLDEEWDEDEDGQLIRTLRQVQLFEVSPVTFPAYPDTAVSVRDIYGDEVAIPERFRRAPDQDGSDSVDAEARARRAAERRREIERVRLSIGALR